MRKIYFVMMIVLCLLLTSCAEMLNGVWKWNFEDYSAFEGTTWKYTNADNLTDTLTFNSDGTYEETVGSTTLKGEYSCTKNTATLKTLTYAKKNYGTEWTGESDIQSNNYLMDGKLYNLVLKSNSNSNNIEGTWNYSSAYVYTNNSSSIIGIAKREWSYTFKDDKTFKVDYSLTLEYDNMESDVETNYSRNGTYSVLDTNVNLVYSDGGKETYILSSPYLILSDSYYCLAKLSTPADLKITEKSYTSVSLSWGDVYGATSYTIYYGKTDSTMKNSITSTSCSCTITGLNDNTTYYFYVVAKNNVCSSEGSDIKSDKTEKYLASGTCGDTATWTLDNNGLLTINGTGKINVLSGLVISIPWKDYLKNITKININYGITEIGSWAFFNCEAVVNISIPNSVTKIDNYSFRDCVLLSSITFSSYLKEIGLGAFAGCTSLSTVTISDSVTTICSNAFSGWTSTQTINIEAVSKPSDWTDDWNGNCEAVIKWNYKNKSVSTVSFNLNYVDATSSPESQTIVTGTTAIEPTAPTRDGYFFTGWYTEDSCTTKYVFSTSVISSLILYAGWAAVVPSTVPTNVSVTIIKDKTATLSWSSDEYYFSVYYSKTNDSSTATQYGTSFTTKTVTVTGLSSKTTYYFWIKAKNKSEYAVISEFSEVVSETTKASVVYSGVCGDNATWTLDEVGLLIISGTGAIENYTVWGYKVTKKYPAPWYDYRLSIKTIQIDSEITSIGSNDFCDCKSLTNITIPDSVTEIGTYAFSGCSALTEFTIPNTISMIKQSTFSECSALTNITIPSSVINIDNEAFSYCRSLSTVTIPDSVKSIGSSSFYGCTALSTLEIPSTVTSIGASSFYGCTALSTLEIPNTVTSIDSYVFSGWTSAQTINIKTHTSAPSGWNSKWNSDCSATINWGQ